MSDLSDDAGDPSTDNYTWQHIPLGYELVATSGEMRLYGAFASHPAIPAYSPNSAKSNHEAR